MNKKYLYHYTNIESLAKILESKAIRFSPLTKLDDLQEEKSQEERSYGKYIFVSSWTTASNENIAMWKMYTNMESGIIIKMEEDPFEYPKFILKSFDETEPLNRKWLKVNNSGRFEQVFAIQNSDPEILFLPLNDNELKVKIEYVDDKEKLLPKIEEFSMDKLTFHFNNLGKYKNRYWEFQNEVRYKMSVIPLEKFNWNAEGLIDGSFNCLNKVKNGEDLPFDYLFVDLCDNSLETMEIIKSPLMSEYNQIILKELVEKYGNNIKILESELSGLLR